MAAGVGLLTGPGFVSLIHHAALPAITLTLISMGLWILLMRNNMLSVLGEDYVKFARAKGLHDRTVAVHYAARNAVLPVFAQLALALGIVVGGQVFIEIVFSYPGIGFLLLNAVENQDYPLIQGIFLIFTVALLLANFLADALVRFRRSASPRRSSPMNWREFRHNRRAMIGASILAAFLVMALFAPVIVPYSPTAIRFTPNLPPDGLHWLGTTINGNDILSQVIWGARASLFVGFVCATLISLIQLVMGVFAGYVGGLFDTVASAITNVFLVLPALPLLIILAAYLQGGSVFVLIAVIVVTGWAWGAKVLRAQAITLRERPFVQASRISGESRWHIVLTHIVPNMLGIIVSNFFGAALFAVLAEAGLEFIGLGNINDVTWGTMLYWAQEGNAILLGEWVWLLVPGLCLALVGTSLGLLNFAVDEIANPRLRRLA